MQYMLLIYDEEKRWADELQRRLEAAERELAELRAQRNKK